jgi:hypothetical protein
MLPAHSDHRASRCPLPAALGVVVLWTLGCMSSPPAAPLVVGPTLDVDLGSITAAQVTGKVLLATAPLGAAAQGAHRDFLAANATKITPTQPVALRGARVRLRAGSDVNDLADVFGGLMIFVAPEADPSARVFVASAIAPTNAGPAPLALFATRHDYERARPALTAPRFIVGVSGPSPLGSDRTVEFGLEVQLDIAIFAELRSGGHWRPH